MKFITYEKHVIYFMQGDIYNTAISCIKYCRNKVVLTKQLYYMVEKHTQ